MKDPAQIIREVQVTEKGTALTERARKYFFRVDPSANKKEIQRAVEQLFNVKVAKVNTIRYLGKKKRERMLKYGRRPDWKRAVVTLAEGSHIDLTT
ncbi:MAG: 50S ribosomal protein L23 [Kiritimatiellia bacterium]